MKNVIFYFGIVAFLAAIVYANLGDLHLTQDGNKIVWPSGVTGLFMDNTLFTVIVGPFITGTGRVAHTAVGFQAGIGFSGDSTTSIGVSAGRQNTASFHTAVGILAGLNNEGNANTALGGSSFNDFNLDTDSAEDITSVDPANNRVTISGGHGFGDDGDFRNLKASTTVTLPDGLTTAINTWEIISPTILECETETFTDEGMGTHTLTPRFIYSRSTAVGFSAEPDASNQVMLGDSEVTEVKTAGNITIDRETAATDAVITMDGSGDSPGTITYESDNDLFITDKDWQFLGNIIIPDDGLIGSVSDPDAIQIEADGDVVMTQDLTVDGTISDGTATLTGGNYNSTGTITSGDITILDPTPILVFRDNNSSGAASVGFIEWRDSGGGRAGFLGNNSSGNDDLFWKNEQGGNIGIQTTGAGKVQIFADVELNGSLAVTDALTANSITTTEFTVEADGDTFWTGSGTGLPYGHMYVDGTQVIRVALTVSTIAEVKGDGTGGTAAAEDGWLTGDLNLMTFPTGGTEHYITITKRGVYHINWNLSFKMVSGAANTQMHGGLAVDGTAIRNKCEAHRTISNNTDTGNMAGSCIVDLPNGNEELSVWLLNSTNSNDADVSHGSLVSVMVGGTTIPTDVLLLETGDGLLLETGDGILLES